VESQLDWRLVKKDLDVCEDKNFPLDSILCTPYNAAA